MFGNAMRDLFLTVVQHQWPATRLVIKEILHERYYKKWWPIFESQAWTLEEFRDYMLWRLEGDPWPNIMDEPLRDSQRTHSPVARAPALEDSVSYTDLSQFPGPLAEILPKKKEVIHYDFAAEVFQLNTVFKRSILENLSNLCADKARVGAKAAELVDSYLGTAQICNEASLWDQPSSSSSSRVCRGRPAKTLSIYLAEQVVECGLCAMAASGAEAEIRYTELQQAVELATRDAKVTATQAKDRITRLRRTVAKEEPEESHYLTLSALWDRDFKTAPEYSCKKRPLK